MPDLPVPPGLRASRDLPVLLALRVLRVYRALPDLPDLRDL